MSAYNIGAGRNPKQIKKMQLLSVSGVCAFCPEHFASYHDNPIEFETNSWLVTKNDYPYEHTSLHLLIISKEHVRSLNQLSTRAKADLANTIALVEKCFKLFSYSIGMRAGDMKYNGGSVEHLHAHIVVGDFSDPNNHQKVRFKMSSMPGS